MSMESEVLISNNKAGLKFKIWALRSVPVGPVCVFLEGPSLCVVILEKHNSPP